MPHPPGHRRVWPALPPRSTALPAVGMFARTAQAAYRLKRAAGRAWRSTIGGRLAVHEQDRLHPSAVEERLIRWQAALAASEPVDALS